MVAVLFSKYNQKFKHTKNKSVKLITKNSLEE